MRLSNGLELTYDKQKDIVRFTKLIKGKLRWLETECKSCKMLFALCEGYSMYSDDDFIREVEATKPKRGD